MTDTLNHLMRAIVEFPAEDCPRLEWADALDEFEQRESPRAEFVRKQIELSRTPKDLPPGQLVYSPGGVIVGVTTHPAPNPVWQALRGRCHQLFDSGWLTGLGEIPEYRQWHLLKPVTGIAPAVSFGCFVNRGFVEQVCCTAGNWLSNADQIHWRPEEREVCGDCDGNPRMNRTGYPTCEVCGASRRVPRPFPTTAQPITAVTLTTAPGYDQMQAIAREVGLDWRPGDETARWVRVLEAKWKGITFTMLSLISAEWAEYPSMPNQDMVDAYTRFTGTTRQLPRRMIYWTGRAGNGDMNDPGNYEGGVIPITGDEIIVPND